MDILKRIFKGKKAVNTDGADFKKVSKSRPGSFSDLVEQNGAFSYEKQRAFGEVIGSNSWQFDMNKGQISFGADLIFSVQIIGSISFGDNSWMWGWANKQSGFPEHLLTQSNKLREIGEQAKIEQLTNAYFNVNGRFDHLIGMIASGVFKSKCYYSANYGKGSLVCTMDSSKIPDVANDVLKLITTFSQFIAEIEVSHKAAFKNYLIDKDYLIKMDDISISGLKNDAVVRAEFDNHGRMKNIKNVG